MLNHPQEDFIPVISLMPQIERASACKCNPMNGVRKSEALCTYMLIYISLIGSLEDYIFFFFSCGRGSRSAVVIS